MKKIGFIGLGLMGHGMAKNLLKKGHALSFVVHRNRANLADLLDLGAQELPTPGLQPRNEIVASVKMKAGRRRYTAPQISQSAVGK